MNDKQSVINKINMDGIIVEQSKEIANALANFCQHRKDPIRQITTAKKFNK